MQVVQQLENQLANLAHCKLGAAGAVPLAAALSAQNSIVALDLRDNGLDGKVGTGEGWGREGASNAVWTPFLLRPWSGSCVWRRLLQLQAAASPYVLRILFFLG